MTDPNASAPTPTVDMPCTLCYLTDRRPATVIAVSPSGAKVTVREDKATRTDQNGVSESQSYTYERDPEGTLHTFYRSADGGYRSPGKWLSLGERHCYHDYSF